MAPYFLVSAVAMALGWFFDQGERVFEVVFLVLWLAFVVFLAYSGVMEDAAFVIGVVKFSARRAVLSLSAKRAWRQGLNPAAFTMPVPATAQGDLGRNALRGFGATQWDLTLRRQFRLTDRILFRREAISSTC
jgi:hypothetical protein